MVTRVKLLIATSLLLLYAGITSPQSGLTTVTATVLDPAGTPYTNSSWSATLVGATDLPRFIGAPPGSAPAPTFATGSTDSFGTFTTQIADNNLITPSGTQWRFQVIYSDRVTNFFCTITITGASQSISAELQACAATLPSVSSVINNSMVCTGQPIRIGDDWYPCTDTGLVTAPSVAPLVAVESLSGGSIADGTYYCGVQYGSATGTTPLSPVSSIVVSGGGGAAKIRIRGAGDYNWVTGGFRYRGACGTSSSGPFFVQQPVSVITTVVNNGFVRTSNVVTVTTNLPNPHPITKYQTVTVAGAAGCAVSPNGTFEVTEVTADNSFTYSQTAADDVACGGAGATVTYTSFFNTNWVHTGNNQATSDLIFATIVLSGTQLSSADPNTATVDPIQVAVNKTVTLNGANGPTVAKGTVRLKGNSVTATIISPLVLWGSTLEGHSIPYLADQACQGYKIAGNWSNANYGVTMIMGLGVTLRNLCIESTGETNAIMWVGGNHNLNSQVLINVFGVVPNNTTTVAAFRLYKINTTQGWRFSNVSGNGGRFNFYASHANLAYGVWDGGRTNCGLSTTGKAFVNAGGPIDIHRGLKNALDPVPSSISIRIDRHATEVCQGGSWDWAGGDLTLGDRTQNADSTHPAGTQAQLNLWAGNWSKGGSATGFVCDRCVIFGHASVNSTIRLAFGFGDYGTNGTAHLRFMDAAVATSSGTGSPVWLDAPVGSFPVVTFEGGPNSTTQQNCNPHSTTALITGTTGHTINCYYRGNGGVASGRVALNRLSNFSSVRPANPTFLRHWLWDEGGASSLDYYVGDTTIVTNRRVRFGHGTIGTQFMKSDGTTPLLDIDHAGNAVGINGVATITGTGAAFWDYTTSGTLGTPGAGKVRIGVDSGDKAAFSNGTTGPFIIAGLNLTQTFTQIPTFGVGAEGLFWRSTTANPAASGAVRLASGDQFCWRNNANSADLCISKNASDVYALPALFLAAPPAIGGTTPNTGAFTTLSASSSPTTLSNVNHKIKFTGSGTVGLIDSSDRTIVNFDAATGIVIVGQFGHNAVQIGSGGIPTRSLGPLEAQQSVRWPTPTTFSSGPQTLDNTHVVILCDTTGGGFTLNLPDAGGVGVPGRIYFIKLINSTNACTIDGNFAQTIDGAATLVITTQNQTYQIISDGSNWRIL